MNAIQKRALRRERVFRDRTNAFELNEFAFRQLFRLPKCVVIELCDNLRGKIPGGCRQSALTLESRVLVALRFYTSGGYQRLVGQDLTLSFSQSSISRCITSVSKAISKHLLTTWVSFPDRPDKLIDVQRGFMDQFDFPGVIGAIGCTHVGIIAPVASANQPEVELVNKKVAHSLKVQLVCDAERRILSIASHFPGFTNQASVWELCRLRRLLEDAFNTGVIVNSWLIGDSGYELEPWLKTPIANAKLDTPEGRHNEALAKACSVNERAKEQLKSTWPCLLKVLHYSPDTASDIINSCAVLYNIYLHHKLPMPEAETEKDGEHLLLPDPPELSTEQRSSDDNATVGQTVQLNLLRDHKFSTKTRAKTRATMTGLRNLSYYHTY